MAERNKGRNKGKREIRKFKYLENEKGFIDEIKSIINDFLRTFIWLKKLK